MDDRSNQELKSALAEGELSHANRRLRRKYFADVMKPRIERVFGHTFGSPSLHYSVLPGSASGVSRKRVKR